MVDLNTMLRQQAVSGLQTQLDTAVTNGDTEAARKITKDIAELAVATAPKVTGFTETEVRAELDVLAPWFGIDPKRSDKAMQFANRMDLKKFATPKAYAEALIKAVDEEFKPAVAADVEDDADDDEPDTDKEPVAKKPRRTDSPGENDAGARSGTRRASSGPWTKISDAPKEVQAEIKRQADKFAPKTDEGRKTFVARSLEANYRMHTQKQGANK